MVLYQSVKRNFRKTRTVKETRKSAKDGRSNKDKPAIDRRVQPFLFPEKRGRNIISSIRKKSIIIANVNGN